MLADAHDSASTYTVYFPSRFESLADSNETLGDADLSFVRSKLAELQTLIAASGTNVSPQLQKLESICLRLLHPVRRLPEDILQEIFLHSCTDLADRPFSSHREELWHMRAPDVLSQVSSRWRTFATGFGPLWSHFLLEMQEHHSPSTGTMFHLGLRLQRSANSLLFIWFNSWGHDVDGQHPFFLLFLPFSARWKSLSVTVSSPSILAHLAPIRYSLPSLRSLWIVCQSQAEEIGPDTTFDAVFSSVPNLRVLYLGVQQPVTTPLPKLERFSQYVMSSRIPILATFPSVLSRVSSISWLVLTLQNYSGIEAGTVLHLPNLRRLAVVFRFPEYLAETLRIFILPALTELKLTRYEAGLHWQNLDALDDAPFIDLIARSRCALMSLDTDVFFQTHQIYGSMPSLESLFLASRDGAGWLHENPLVIVLPLHSAFLPKLKIVEIRTKIPDEDHKTLVEWVEARVSAAGGGEDSVQLKQVSMRGHIVDADLLKRIQACCDISSLAFRTGEMLFSRNTAS